MDDITPSQYLTDEEIAKIETVAGQIAGEIIQRDPTELTPLTQDDLYRILRRLFFAVLDISTTSLPNIKQYLTTDVTTFPVDGAGNYNPRTTDNYDPEDLKLKTYAELKKSSRGSDITLLGIRQGSTKLDLETLFQQYDLQYENIQKMFNSLSSVYALIQHNHAAESITSGLLSPDRIPEISGDKIKGGTLSSAIATTEPIVLSDDTVDIDAAIDHDTGNYFGISREVTKNINISDKDLSPLSQFMSIINPDGSIKSVIRTNNCRPSTGSSMFEYGELGIGLNKSGELSYIADVNAFYKSIHPTIEHLGMHSGIVDVSISEGTWRADLVIKMDEDGFNPKYTKAPKVFYTLKTDGDTDDTLPEGEAGEAFAQTIAGLTPMLYKVSESSFEFKFYNSTKNAIKFKFIWFTIPDSSDTLVWS